MFFQLSVPKLPEYKPPVVLGAPIPVPPVESEAVSALICDKFVYFFDWYNFQQIPVEEVRTKACERKPVPSSLFPLQLLRMSCQKACRTC